jgi:putative toxin-antitoxin system antitoxin component (TIGR02293 family)
MRKIALYSVQSCAGANMISTATVASVLGRPGTVGSNNSPVRLLAEVRAGLPYDVLAHLVETGVLTSEELEKLIPKRTLQDRKRRGTLSREQSDLAVRIARIDAIALRVFGSVEKARQWLRWPVAALDCETPLSLLDTEEGGRVVEAILGRIEHGVFS